MTSASSNPFAFPFASFNTHAFSGFFPENDSMSSLTRGAMEASAASTRASVKGMQDAGQAMMSHLKSQMNLSVEMRKKLSKAGNLEDAFAIQTRFMKSAFENNLKGFNEMTELYSETLREAFAPIATQAKKAAKSSKAA